MSIIRAAPLLPNPETHHEANAGTPPNERTTMNATSNDWRFARDDPERVMRDDIRTKLDAFFAPRLQRLATLVGEDLY